MNVEEIVKIETTQVSTENIRLFLKLLLRDGYSFSSSLEIQIAIKKEFNICVDLDDIEKLWALERELKDIEYQMKNLNLYQ